MPFGASLLPFPRGRDLLRLDFPEVECVQSSGLTLPVVGPRREPAGGHTEIATVADNELAAWSAIPLSAERRHRELLHLEESTHGNDKQHS
jgi:hypothetical protein